jgi:hypothetical protein
MRKTFKIIIEIFATMIIIVVVFGAIILLDVAAYTARGLQTLTLLESQLEKPSLFMTLDYQELRKALPIRSLLTFKQKAIPSLWQT